MVRTADTMDYLIEVLITVPSMYPAAGEGQVHFRLDRDENLAPEV